MKLVGHRTESVYRRYAIVDEGSLREAAGKPDAVAELGTILGTVTGSVYRNVAI
jgi:hypothetical protein